MKTEIIGIAGGIGSGKSVVSRILRCQGHQVYDCDFEAKRIMDESLAIRKGIAEIFGDEAIDGEGNIRRGLLREVVFVSESHRLALNSLVHKEVDRHIRKALENARGDLFFLESAIMARSGLINLCDRGIWVEAPQDVRLQRVLLRDDRNKAAVHNIMAAQSEEREMVLGSDKFTTINNDGSESLLLQVDSFLKIIA